VLVVAVYPEGAGNERAVQHAERRGGVARHAAAVFRHTDIRQQPGGLAGQQARQEARVRHTGTSDRSDIQVRQIGPTYRYDR